MVPMLQSLLLTDVEKTRLWGGKRPDCKVGVGTKLHPGLSPESYSSGVVRSGSEDIPKALSNLETDVFMDLWPAFPGTDDVPTMVGWIHDGAMAPGRAEEGAEFASKRDTLSTELSTSSRCKRLGRGGATAETLGMVLFKDETSFSRTTTDVVA